MIQLVGPARALGFVLAATLFATVASAQFQPGAGSQAPGTPLPAARDNNQQPATGVIRGRVVAADTGRPIRRAHVRIAGADLPEGRGVDTDARPASHVVQAFRPALYR